MHFSADGATAGFRGLLLAIVGFNDGHFDFLGTKPEADSPEGRRKVNRRALRDP